ncbi:MAG TPA: pyridoxal phosphate-dependent aminotransferase [Steroidobacteraceae bacterium]|nr:pyridoxal phosphate-dependent aminotransferase [Steroidobacteraceae bacterium]
MKLPPFKLDLWLAAHEFATPPIRFNLASSTGPAWTLAEIAALGGGDVRAFDEVKLSYAPPAGGKLLRERLAAREGVDAERVLVMTGASEVLLTLCCHLAAPGASLLVPKPVYPALPAMARAWGLNVREYALDPARGFAQEADAVLAQVDATTRAVFVNTPHNPTGSIMTATEQRKLATALAARDVLMIVDEVYHPLYFGAASSNIGTPGAARLLQDFPNVVVLGDFAKALSLPGLRLGWLVDRDAVRREALLDLRSYFSISSSPLCEAIGAHALAHSASILGRLEAVARANLALLSAFMEMHGGLFAFPAPAGGTTCFPCLRDGRDARPLAERLAKAGVLVAPGDCFDMPSHLRIGFGAQREGYAAALDVFSEVISDWR